MIRTALFLLFCALLSGCGKNRIAALTDRAEVYNRSLKWGSLQAAGAVLAQANRRTLLEKISREVAQHPIVEYAVLDMSVDPGEKKGSLLVEFSYYGTSDQTLRYRQEMQSWQWDSAKREWFLLEARDLPSKRD